MAGSSNFQEFNPSVANAQSDGQYTSDASRLNGLSNGLASPTLHNKLFRQISVMCAAIGQFIANQGYTASDTDLTALTSAVTSAIRAVGSILATAREVLLSTTNPTTVTSYTPTTSGNFLIGTGIRVVSGTTNVTVAITYTDAGGAQTNTMLSVQSTLVGSWSLLPLYIDAVAGSPITITMTAGTANRVYASASIVRQ
jgi:hypothetical protein